MIRAGEVLVTKKLKHDETNLKRMAADESLSDVEKKFGVKPPNRTQFKRLGYPKSDYYELFTRDDAQKNKQQVEEFLEKV